MKRIIPIILTLGVILGACKQKNQQATNTNKNMVLVDTTGLSNSNALTDVGNNKYVITKEPVAAAEKPVPRSSSASTKVNKSNTVSSSRTNSTSNASYPQRDKGWSSAAKGTAIGGGTGAILGAVVSDNKVKGGIIGAVVGAGAGYAIGRSRDKKSGRVARKRAWKKANTGQ